MLRQLSVTFHYFCLAVLLFRPEPTSYFIAVLPAFLRTLWTSCSQLKPYNNQPVFAPILAVLDDTYGVASLSTASSFFLCHRIRSLSVRLFVFFCMFSRAIWFFLVLRVSIFHISSSLALRFPFSPLSPHARYFLGRKHTPTRRTPDFDLRTSLLHETLSMPVVYLPPGCPPPPRPRE